MLLSKSLLYIGNKLTIHGNTATSIDTLGKLLEDEGFKVYYASSKKNKTLRLFDMILTCLQKVNKVDYVFIDVYSTQNFWFALITSQICRIFNCKYIAKLHGGNLPNRLEKNPYLSDLIFKNAYKITAPSEYLMSFFTEKYSSNLIYIPNTIEIENYNFLNRKIDCPKLLWVRSLATIYNPKMAIQVFSEIKKEYPNAILTMVGPDKNNLLESLISYSTDLNVEVNFTGLLSKEEWITLSESYNIFINTTHFDNTPVSLIEAMALGLPVISTNVGGIPYLIDNNLNGLLVDDDNVEQMVDAIKKITNDTLLKDKIALNARKKVEKFNWDIVKKEWIEILN
jgi:glycosyltransferase involved in cell wall biosynthesis